MSVIRIGDLNDPRDRELVEMLQDLVRIPSWVPEEEALKPTQNENGVVDYLENWLKKNTGFQVERQLLAGGRYNLIARRGKPEVILLGHTDTVRPSENSPYDPLAAEIHDGKIWGRGTGDMKSGIAAMLQSLQLAPDVDNVWIILYADEEYDFLGMKALVKDYGDLRPKLLISADGGGLEIGYGCRGLIEFKVRVKGETGHPASGNGKNAILGTFAGLAEIQKYLAGFKHPVMGGSSFNVGYMIGGALLPDSIDKGNSVVKVGRAANVVPDVSEFNIDIRPSSPDLTCDMVIERLKDYLTKNGLGVEILERKHDLGAWYTEAEELRQYIEIARDSLGAEVQLEDPAKRGYVDLQMLWEAVGRPVSFSFGGGGPTAHKPDEHIVIEDFIKTRDVFLNVLKSLK